MLAAALLGPSFHWRYVNVYATYPYEGRRPSFTHDRFGVEEPKKEGLCAGWLELAAGNTRLDFLG
jgi:hypothetical protein